MKKVMAGGVFAAVHPGHIFFLRKAKSLGDFLVVVLANDSNIRKPYSVPSAEERKRGLEALGIADKVVVGGEGDFFRTVEKERPDIIALGYDQEMPGLEKRIKSAGLKTEIKRIEKHGDYSTAKLKSRRS